MFGTELSEVAVAYALENQHLSNVVFSDLSDEAFNDIEFQAVNLTNVLEHVPSPRKILENCHRRLESKGLLTVRVPNMDLFTLKERFNSILRFAGLAKGGDMNYLASPAPTHLTGFPPRTLKKYFRKAGFETIEIKPSKLSTMAEENLVFRVFEKFVRILYLLSLRRINLSPTILAIAEKK